MAQFLQKMIFRQLLLRGFTQYHQTTFDQSVNFKYSNKQGALDLSQNHESSISNESSTL